MSRLRVVLADDHALVRAGIRSLLGEIEGVEVVGETGDGREALRLVAELSPDVLLLDIGLPGLNGLDVASRVEQGHPRTRVLVLSMHASEDYVRQALEAGAAGYLLKDSALEELGLALRAVAEGRKYLTPAVSERLVTDYLRRGEPASGGAPRLSPRQREVLQLIAEGHSTKEIAFALSVSVKTVETHRAELMERLDIHDVAGLVRYAVRTGVVDPER